MYTKLSDINVLDVAITSVCNALCMDCSRWWAHHDQQFHNPVDTHTNHHWPWQQLIDHTMVLPNIKRILICGNAGDPMSHPNISDIVETWHQQWPHCDIEIDTNGSLGSDQQWQVLSQLDRVRVRFAVDGLDDTNHIYRRGVPWHRVQHNIQRWSDWGCRGTLKTIDFPWNESQRDQIHAWSKQLNFNWLLDARWSPHLDQHIQSLHRNQPKPSKWLGSTDPHEDWHDTHIESMIRTWISHNKPMQAECRSDGEWLYINHDHRVWPCCYWANVEYSQNHAMRFHQRALMKEFEPNWNSLYHHTLEQILQHPMLKNLEQLWQGTDKSNTSSLCLEQCSGCFNRASNE